MITALHHAQSLQDAPTFLVTGGDAVMDVFGADASRAKIQWDIWQRVFKHECGISVAHCIGNHDIWGWNKERSRTTGTEPLWGKSLAIEKFSLPHRYYSFERAGWKFIILDSVQPNQNGYLGYLDEEQYYWLENELRQTPQHRPIVIISHIPILTVTGHIYDQERIQQQQHIIPGSWVHTDTYKLKELFLQYPNVKLCLSGHMHLLDWVKYNDATYICGGAVCGGWWEGNSQECEEGYGLIDLYDDGSFDYQYIAYGWQPKGK